MLKNVDESHAACGNVEDYKGDSTFLPVQITCGTSTDMIN